MNPSHPPPPPPPPSIVAFPTSHHPNLPPPPPPPLSDAFSNLTSLLHLSTAALRSLPAPVAAAAPAASPTFLHCPLNPNHRLPPSSLFSHYLNCPSPLFLPHAFHYPLTLVSSTVAATSVSLSTTSSDLFVSLENYASHNANFFYEKCPGPVSPSIRPPPFFHLPRVLHIECADFNDDSQTKESTGFPADFIRFLPSEIWAIRSETEAWGGVLPPAYSSRILRAILRLRDCNLSHLNLWMVSGSPRYGMIIDFAMSVHLISLIRLCLKAIVSEAFAGGFMFGKGKLTSQSFECPVLVKVMTWLALQFGVLYGEVNGKFFAVDVLRECLSDSASHASMFPLEQKDDGVGENVKGETVGSSKIFVPQVAAAVAALHERLYIEEKIKALRNSQTVSAYERNIEHAYVSKIADEERLKRPDYKSIIEYDGFLRQRTNNEEGNTVKTREELLAEERDYKRRRVSYRGKKSNRSTAEVMRGIIEKYMEEIKQAGGIGDESKSLEKTEPSGYENLNAHSSATDVSRPRTKSEIPEENRDPSLSHDIQRLRRDSSRDRGHRDPNRRSVERIKHDRDGYYSGRSHERQSESHEKKHQKRNRDDERERNNHERERDELERASRKRERYEDRKENKDRGRSKARTARRERDVDIRDSKMNKKSNRSHRELREFGDRYDPTESRGFSEDVF